MRNRIFVFLVVFISASFMAFYVGDNPPSEGEHEFVGVKTCGMCHKKDTDGNQLKVWEGSKHSNAYKTLQTAEADKIAKEAGFETKAVETKECLVCHASGYDVDAKLVGKKFDVADGVQCETCHGAGGDYKSMKVMKSMEESVKNGLIVWEDDKAIEAMCKTCHNEKSPTFKAFDFAKMYEKVKHNIPKK